MNDYLVLESLITDRLKDQIDGITARQIRGLPKVHEAFDLAPAVLVTLDTDNPGAVANNGATHKVEQIWVCILAVDSTDSKTGSYLSQIICALSGWSSDAKRFSPFVRVPTKFMPDVSPNGVYYFPLAFSTSFVFNI